MSEITQIVRLFPLPGVVLFPRAVLPLHVFEERYKFMVADAIKGDGQIAIALLKPGWERDYYSRPEIDQIVCVGRIINYETLPDGRYNLLLQGKWRGKIEHEIGGKSYRLAKAQPLNESAVQEMDLGCERWRLQELFLQAQLGAMGKHYLELISSGLATAEVADLLAFNLIENTDVKQSLLAETDVVARVQRIVDLLQGIIPILRQTASAQSAAMN